MTSDHAYSELILPDPTQTPMLTVEEAAKLFRLGRSKAYLEARRYLETEGREGLPAIAFGRSLRCPTARLLALLGMPGPGAGG